MRILFLNSIGKKKYGGGEKWMIRAAQELGKRGHTVFLGAKTDSLLLQKATAAGVQTWGIDIHADISPIATFRMVNFLRANKIEILICNLNKDVRVGGLAARLAKTPVVLARHGMLLCGKKWKHKVTLTNLTDGIITNTNSIKQTYASYGWFRDDFVKVIYNGVELAGNIEPYDFQTRYPGKKIVLSAGRLAGQKGYDYLILAAAKICRHRKDIVFLIAGEGKLEDELRGMIAARGLSQNFHLLGFHADIRPLILGSDLFVLASRFEGMPNVVMEAMSVGKAVVATDVNGVRELMEDGISGLIIPPHHPDALAEAILKVIDSPATLENMGRKGREIVRTKFTYNIMADNLEKHLLDRLGQSDTPTGDRIVSSKAVVRKLKRRSLTLLSDICFSKLRQPDVAVPEEPGSVAIFVQEKLGDALLLNPVIRLLAVKFPEARISLFTFSKATHGFFRGDPHIDRCYLVRLYNLPLICHLSKQKYDLLYNPKDHPSNTFLLLTALLKASCKVAIHHELHRGFYHRLLKVDFAEQVIRKNLAVASLWGIEVQPEDLIPYLPEQPVSPALQSFADDLTSKPVALNLSAGEPHRLWPGQSWVQLVDMIEKEIIILAMPSERELKKALEKRFKHVISSPPTANLAEASLILGKCCALVSPDTSLVHLSMITSTPVVGLYRFDPIHHQRFAPLSEHSRKLVSPTHSIAGIRPKEVLACLQEVLNEVRG